MKQQSSKYHHLTFLGMFLLSSSLSLLAVPPAAPQELLEYLITQNEAARAKIRSFSCTLDITQNGRTRTAQLKQQGSCLWLASNQPAKTGPIAGHQTRMVVNNRYMAEYILPIPRSVMSYGNWRDYDSFETMDNETKRRIQTNTPDDFFTNCFGTISESFRWSMTRRPDIRWDAVQSTDTDGRTVYQIRRFGSRSNLPYPDAVWVVDPDKGFMVTETFAYSGGKVFLHRSMQVEQVADGVWFPVSFQQENYRQGFMPQISLSNWKRVSVRDLQVNNDIPAEQFEFDALNLWEDAPDVIVLRIQTDGTKIPYVYDNTGQLIPQRERDRQNATPVAAPEGGTGDLLGAVVDSHSKGIGGVYVFICEQDSGIPLSPKTRQPFTKQMGRSDELELLYAVTDDDGNFIFKDIPAGKYRLVSQSWKDVKAIKGALEVNGNEIQLHGIAENIHASPAASPYRIELRPLGTGILQVDADLPNDETLLVVSTSPTQADPILGFAGWSGPFMQHMIGGNRMPSGQTTIYGLPEGTLYLAMFAADNSPGFAEAQVAVRPNETTVLEDIQFVAGWSDARHDPPQELLAVFEEIKSLVLSKDEFLLNLFKEYGLMDSSPEKGPWAFMDGVSRNLTKEVTLPSGRTATFGEIAAAWKYVELQQWQERKANRR